MNVSGDGARVTNFTSGAGDAGDLTIATGTLIIQDGGQVLTLTAGKGNAGNVTVTASESVELRGNAPDSRFASILGAQVAKEGEGNAGDITIETVRLSIRDGTQVNNSTFGVGGDAGNLIIRASEVEVIGESADGQFDSGIHAQVEIGAEGNAKDILIEAVRLTLRDGGQVSAATFGVGNAGNLTVRASEVELIGTAKVGRFPSRLRVRVEPGGKGDAGNLTIETEQLIVRDGADVTADTAGSGVGGNIDVQAGSLTLDRGTITAETVRNQGGDINLTISDLLTLRNNSQITATAGTAQAGGNGGNITIDAPFIIAFPQENSDITANAFEGNGGNITINTNGIFGIEFRDRETPLSDITASSEFGQQGEVEINTSAINPTRGLNNLPQDAVEAEVAQSCQETASQSTLEFFDIGRGGLPPSPDDLFSSETVIAEWIPLDLADDKIQKQTLDEIVSEAEFTTISLLKLSCHSK